MQTELAKVDPVFPEPAVVRRAAELIRAGRLVAFPTETVYGLGASARDAQAVRGVFAAKGRPGSNPLIVHVSEVSHVLNVARDWPETADRLAHAFWPGPLTLVLPRRSDVPDEVTAGGPTVAVRCPNHPVAQSLLRESGVPIAAPSANRSTELSPTRAEHVLASLGGRIDMVLDGGPCLGGIESTVVDVTGDRVRLLRPGLISMPMLEEVTGEVAVGAGDGPARSPGLMARHYSPRTKLVLIDVGRNFLENVQKTCELYSYGRVGELHFGARGNRHSSWCEDLSPDPSAAAARLYDVLHRLDEARLDAVFVEMPPDTPEWAAVRDRLTRAAA